MPEYTFKYEDYDIPGDVTAHSKAVSGAQYDYLPAIIQAFNDFLISAGFSYLQPTIEQPEHGVYIIRHESAAAKSTQLSLFDDDDGGSEDNLFEVGDYVYVANDSGFDDRIVTGRYGILVSIDHKKRPEQPYEIEFSGWTGGHPGTSSDATIKNRFFLTPNSIVLGDEAALTV